MTLWKLSPEQIGALNAAGALQVRFAMPSAPSAGHAEAVKPEPIPVVAVISGAGFAAAVNATMGNGDLLH